MDDVLKYSKLLQSSVESFRKEMEAERNSIEEDKKKLQDEKQLMDSRFPIDQEVIELNVGGVHYDTSKKTLMKYEGSLLHSMFSGSYPLPKDKQGRYFIDQHGATFGDILFYLQNGDAQPKDEFKFRTQMKFFGLPIPKAMMAPVLNDSLILGDDDRKQLEEWLLEDRATGPEIESKLLFRASQHDFRASAFHSHCDGKGPTLVIVKVGEWVFGGFTPVSWHSNNSYSDAQGKSWLFSLKNPSAIRAKIPNVAGNGPANLSIAGYGIHGPLFGGGHDFGLSDQCNANNDSCSNLSHSYNAAKLGLTYGSTGKTFFAGSDKFKVTEYEVYSIQ